MFGHLVGARNISWAAFSGYMVMRGHVSETLWRGLLRIATDQTDYFREIERLAGQSTQFVISSDPEPQRAPSTFEKRFRESEIYRLVLRKVSDVT